MKKINLIFLIIFLTNVGFAQSFSKELISSNGNSIKSGNYILTWSVGENCTELLDGSPYFLTQGFHQGKFTITPIIEHSQCVNLIKVFPNPTSEILSVEFTTPEIFTNNKYQIQLIGSDGKILLYKQSVVQSNQLNLESFKSGIYFLKVFNSLYQQTFKIIKN